MASIFYDIYKFLFPRYSSMVTPLIMILIFAILNRVYFKDNRKTLLFTFFALYLVIVYRITGLPDSMHINFRPRFQLIPFYGIVDDAFNCALNVFLFIPFGFFITALWRDFFSCKNAVLTSMGFSLFIETLQILCPRLTDVNDIITNTLGGFLGFCLIRVFTKSDPRLFRSPFKKRECVLVFGTTFSILFFINPIIVKFLVDVRLLINRL